MPRWIAHRGGGHWAPENTLAAFRVGRARGFQGFECDVQLSRDGVAVIIHDHTLGRTPPHTGVVRELDARDLGRLDAGGWHSPAFAGEGIPTLDDLLAWADCEPIALNLELKPASGDEAALAQTVDEALARRRDTLQGRILISSFSTSALAAVSAMSALVPSASAWPRAWLAETLQDGDPERACALGCQGLSAHHRAWTRSFVNRAHALGLACSAYTVNDATTAKRLFDVGVDSLFTDTLPPQD